MSDLHPSISDYSFDWIVDNLINKIESGDLEYSDLELSLIDNLVRDEVKEEWDKITDKDYVFYNIIDHLVELEQSYEEQRQY